MRAARRRAEARIADYLRLPVARPCLAGAQVFQFGHLPEAGNFGKELGLLPVADIAVVDGVLTATSPSPIRGERRDSGDSTYRRVPAGDHSRRSCRVLVRAASGPVGLGRARHGRDLGWVGQPGL